MTHVQHPKFSLKSISWSTRGSYSGITSSRCHPHCFLWPRRTWIRVINPVIVLVMMWADGDRGIHTSHMRLYHFLQASALTTPTNCLHFTRDTCSFHSELTLQQKLVSRLWAQALYETGRLNVERHKPQGPFLGCAFNPFYFQLLRFSSRDICTCPSPKSMIAPVSAASQNQRPHISAAGWS